MNINKQVKGGMSMQNGVSRKTSTIDTFMPGTQHSRSKPK